MSEQQRFEKSAYKTIQASFIQPQESAPLPIRILTKIDIFSFIPVPKDDPVSTRQSLIGTAVFFLIFLAYIAYDFYQFVADNPPNAQNFYTNLQNNEYQLPRFAITFMRGQYLNQSALWNQYINFGLTQEWKDKGEEDKVGINIFVNNFTTANRDNPKNDSVLWIDDKTKSFYNVLRTSSQNLFARGMLYSTANATYSKIKIKMCNYTDPKAKCETEAEIKQFCGGGRIFLFFENIYDTTSYGHEDESNSPKFFIYNFFLEPRVYKRVTFNFQVVETVVQPDYFFRFTRQTQRRLQIASYIEQSSNVAAVIKKWQQPLDMLGIQMQLYPQILNVKVTYRTLLDHVSMWGAFWGVLFALFALMFLTYNRKKFYRKNPEWDKFKQNNYMAGEEDKRSQ